MELIKLQQQRIADEAVDTVNARDLHAFLDSGEHFATWIKDRIQQYGFTEGRDFVTFSGIAEKGRPPVEYALSLDMAKELAMVERNEKGKQARQYFIECERRARSSPVLSIPTTLSGALRLAAEQAEQIEQQRAQLVAAAPAVAFVERYVDSTGCKGFRQVCKLLGANENDFRRFLEEEKIMYRLSGEWTPYAHHLDTGRFNVRAGTSQVSGHAFNTSKFTPKGVTWVAGEFAKWQLKQRQDHDAEPEAA